MNMHTYKNENTLPYYSYRTNSNKMFPLYRKGHIATNKVTRSD